MREWLDHTTARILATKPRRVLELGCGSGMILFGLAPHCEHYVALDLSAVAVAQVAAKARARGLGHVEVHVGQADHLDDIPVGSVDTIILNSVVQYFPDETYLVTVLEKAAARLTPGGTIFVGDVRSLPLHEAFCAAVELEGAPAELSVAELRQRIEQRRLNEGELVIDPRFFHALTARIPELDRPKIEIKRGRHHNEMSRFRYDVTLRKTPASPPRCAEAVPWESLPSALKASAVAVVVHDLRDARVARELRLVHEIERAEGNTTVSELRGLLDAPAATNEQPVDPDSLLSHGGDHDVAIYWSAAGVGRFSAMFTRRGHTPLMPAHDLPEEPSHPLSDYVRTPRQRRSKTDIASELKAHVSSELPEFMVPAAIVVLDALPLTPNGKVDRKALPVSGKTPQDTHVPYVAPSSDIEERMAAIWRELLGLDRVSTQARLKDLGANSLLMFQANVRLKAELKHEVSLVEMFRFPTIAALADHLRAGSEPAKAAAEGLARGQARRDAMQRRRRAPS
jgi:SAM-dependent methyltransferase/acyl carrier protein